MSVESHNEAHVNLVVSFIGASSWIEGKRMIKQHPDVFLTDVADEILTNLIVEFAGNEKMIRDLTINRDLLRQIRAEGLDTPSSAKGKLASTESAQESDELDIHPELLDLLKQEKSEEEIRQMFDAHPELLSILKAMEGEIDEHIDEQVDLLIKEFTDALQGWMAQKTWEESKAYFIEHQKILLKEKTVPDLEWFVQTAQQYGDTAAVQDFATHLDIVRRALAVGIDAAFAEHAGAKEAQQDASGGQSVPRSIFATISPDVLTRLKRAETPKEIEQVLTDNPELVPLIEQLQAHMQETTLTLMRTLEEWINNPNNWPESKTYLEAHPELLSIETDDLMNHLIAKYAGNKEAVETLTQHRDILRRVRVEDIEAVYQDVAIGSDGPVEHAAALKSFLNTRNWSEKKRILEEQQELLLSDTADELLSTTIEHYTHDVKVTNYLIEQRQVLRRARKEGIDVALADYIQDEQQEMRVPAPMPPDLYKRLRNVQSQEEVEQLLVEYPGLEATVHVVSKELVYTVARFCGMATWPETKAFLEEHPELVSDDGDRAMRWCIADKADEEIRDSLIEHHNILLRARDEGIDVAFADYIDKIKPAPKKGISS